MSDFDHYKTRKLYGRRQGRALSKERLAVLDNVLPKLAFPDSLKNDQHTTRPQDLFQATYNDYWLEIGFGQGEHVVSLAQRNPDTGYIAAEPFVNGMAAFLKDAQHAQLQNICALMDDGMIAARSLTANSLNGIYVLNPDPWHKTRHHKRRIINHDNLDIFAKILKPRGQLVMSTDVPDLASWMCLHAVTHPAFQWCANIKSDWSTPPSDWVPTRYETKGAKGARKMIYLFFEKKAE